MKLTTFFTYCLCIPATIVDAAASYDKSTYNNSEAAAQQQIAEWRNQYRSYIEGAIKTRESGCTSENIVYRQEWGCLSKKTRQEYTTAVQCLMDKPATYPKSEVPGGRSRFDDFSATHISRTPYVHFDGVFFHFHRYFLWLYERALRTECNYTGTQPYWDWTLSYLDPSKSPIFDGSPSSMGSDGLSTPHGIVTVSAFGLTVPINPGTGGGCVSRGPFANHTITLGPVSFPPAGADGGLGSNPRCLARDLHPEWTKHTKPSDIVRLFNKCNDLECFDADIEGSVGLHTAGHFAVGGVLMDPWASPQDPVFFLHHAGVDRVWSLWQGLRPDERVKQVYGTQTAFNDPPSPNVTLDTAIDYMRLAPKQRLGDLVSTVDGPFCYAYI